MENIKKIVKFMLHNYQLWQINGSLLILFFGMISFILLALALALAGQCIQGKGMQYMLASFVTAQYCQGNNSNNSSK